MTTIATDGKTMAADGLVTDGDTIVSTQASKLRRLTNGDVIGVTGKLGDEERFLRWLNAGGEGKPDGVWERSEVLMLRADGMVFWMDADGRFADTPRPAAIGSGMDFALAAMDAGATPIAAVAIACARDVRSGGNTMSIEPRRPCAERVAT